MRGFGITASLFPERMLKNATRTRKSCIIIQPIRWRLQNSFSVSNFVCHMHQTFSQRSVGVTSKAPFTLQVTLSDKATRSHSFQWRAGDFRRHERQRPLATGWGVSSDATKFRILQLYANEERLSGVTANRKEDGWAHVIVLLSAVDKHTQWEKNRLCFSFIFVCMYGLNSYLYYI